VRVKIAVISEMADLFKLIVKSLQEVIQLQLIQKTLSSCVFSFFFDRWLFGCQGPPKMNGCPFGDWQGSCFIFIFSAWPLLNLARLPVCGNPCQTQKYLHLFVFSHSHQFQ
jgi:hypothetical protein